MGKRNAARRTYYSCCLRKGSVYLSVYIPANIPMYAHTINTLCSHLESTVLVHCSLTLGTSAKKKAPFWLHLDNGVIVEDIFLNVKFQIGGYYNNNNLKKDQPVNWFNIAFTHYFNEIENIKVYQIYILIAIVRW